MAVRFRAKSRFYLYDRGCLYCKKYPCRFVLSITDNAEWLDLGRCGCTAFEGTRKLISERKRVKD